MQDVSNAGHGEERLRRLIDVGRAVVTELDLEAVLQRVLEAARELTDAKYAALGVLDENGRELERFLTVGIDDATRASIGDLPRGRGVLGVLISDPKPLRLDDVGRHPQSFGFPLEHPPMRSFLGVPILIRGQPFGNLYLTEKSDGSFDQGDEDAVVVLADWAAIAIQNARAYSRLQEWSHDLERAVARFEATTEIAAALAGQTDLRQVLELVVKRGRALTEARAMLMLLERGSELEVAAIAGELEESLVGARLPIEGSVSGAVLRSGVAERLPDVSSRLRFALAEQTQARTGLFVPMQLRGRVLGVLAAFDRLREGPEFTTSDEELLSGFAASAAAAVATAQDAATQSRRRSIAATEQERARWARELHDDTLQELAGLKLLLGSFRRTEDPQERERVLAQAAERIDLLVRGLRRLITELRPAALDDYGLHAALEALASRAAEGGLDVRLQVDLSNDAGRERRLDAEIEETLYRLVQEALSNVAKHAHATHVEVRLLETTEAVEVVVRDDGVGFDTGQEASGFGLLGMRERVLLVGGTISVESTGEGTVVRAMLPAARAEVPPAAASVGP
ncbi:MAG TPA: GAF domain-containing protein [Gaiellaceae bacterium]|nr:GAF domain-containing protein [Gaiellaceae bacterium]